MRYIAIAATCLTALCGPMQELAAQVPAPEVLARFSSIQASVIRIRTIADLEYAKPDHETGEMSVTVHPYSVDGTGVVIGSMMVNGNKEYLILTNHHVADASNYVLEDGGYLRVNPRNTRAVPSAHEESYLMEAESDTISSNDIHLTELVRLVRGDMTLMRTVGANRELTVFGGPIGYRHGDVSPGTEVITSGFPWGGDRLIAVGSVLECDYPHELGIPHKDFVLDLPVKPGQSGGPIFMVEQDEATGAISFRLIGLVHAKDPERNYGVTYESWKDALDEFPAVLQPRLVR